MHTAKHYLPPEHRVVKDNTEINLRIKFLPSLQVTM